MSFETDKKEGEMLVRIDGGMTVADAAAIRDKLVACFDSCESLIADLRDVADCDAAGVQLICSAHKTADATGKRFAVVNASEAVIKAVARAGLHPEKLLGI
ncbi:anti-sigma factor antagonist [Desulfonema ishimotonii]|uniref:Anti-sigma factor antagonist n=1 Tax=Desulfonema ishimotonii TaxID=45657 RepID=A0A401FUR6_9BACT|nr:STAS domain-containing protein [Desulfonema ishimotonii]GBC60706.1 anti-sigma factor antagonist [Desulfonema ishimotonii]